MFDGTGILVYFICPYCGKYYVAKQKRGLEPGRFYCMDCGLIVHDWSGPYTFKDWKSV